MAIKYDITGLYINTGLIVINSLYVNIGLFAVNSLYVARRNITSLSVVR